MNWKELLRVIAPVVLVNVKGGKKIGPLVPVIIDAIEDAEDMKGASGAEKKAKVLEIVEAGVTVANSTGKVKLVPAEVQAVASHGIDAVIAATKVVEKSHAGGPTALASGS